MKQVPCAGRCGTMMDKVDEHAVGWRPLCEPCRISERTWWFESYRPGQIASVRGPRPETFGRNPQGQGYVLPASVVRKAIG